MLRYIEVQVGLSEVPEEIALCINISGCPIHCKGCHSPHLWNDVGEELKPVVLSDLIAKNDGITCVAFMGGDSDVNSIVELARWVKNNTELKTCWYSGSECLVIDNSLEFFDYVKKGAYNEELGGLDNPNTNQRFYKVVEDKFTHQYLLEDLTYKFWRKG